MALNLLGIFPQIYQHTIQQKRAVNVYNTWRKRTSLDWFEGTEWQEWRGNWTRRSTCGKYRLIVMIDRIRIVSYNLPG